MNRLKLIIKILFLFLLVINFLNFAAHKVNIYTSIPNYGSNRISKCSTSSGIYGVTSFDFISEDKIALLCSSERKIKIFNLNANQMISEFQTDFFPEDFAYGYSGYYILSDYSLHCIDDNGKKLKQIKINEEFKFIDKIKTIDNSLYILTSDGNSYKIIDNGNPIDPEYQSNYFTPGWLINKSMSVNSIKNDDHNFALNIFMNSKLLKEKIISVDQKLGSAVIVGATDSIVYIDVQYIIEDIPLKIKRSIFAYSLSNENIIDKIEIPDNYQFYTKHDVTIYKNNLIKLISLQDRTDLLKLTYNSESSKTSFPLQYNREYHYNYNLPNLESEIIPRQIVTKSNAVQSITRSQILANADKYEKVKWYCSEKNTSNNTIINLPDGGVIRTPKWVVVGSKVKMPYKWGGFTNIENFNPRIDAGSYAGDDYTSREQNVVSFGDTYCVGVDCSGFVSLVWGRTQREWTGSLPSISTQLESWSQVQPGDIANKSGSHTMLFVSRNPSGSFNIIHASGYDWRVSYATVSLNDLSGYVPLKYKNVEEITEVNKRNITPTVYKLLQNYPNPFNPSTIISYQLPLMGHVDLQLYDILGKEVAVLVNEEQNAGNYEVKFNGSNLASGIYFIKLQVNNFSKTEKIVLLK